ncbi:MAG: hypothetical protein KC425_06055 [Anaerolineales bacterium]|nr:hypothetical protein [Anaerolineales bacterium]
MGRFVWQALLAAAAALAGNWLGSRLRAQVTGEAEPAFQVRVEVDGMTAVNVPIMTRFYPALLAALLGKPRWLAAFVAGALTGALVSTEVERRWLGWFIPRVLALGQRK